MKSKKQNEIRVVMIDHLDSFTNNTVDLLRVLGAQVHVVRTDVTLEVVERLEPTHIVLSAGEGHPKDVRLFYEVLKKYQALLPILGICLGSQAIGVYHKTPIVRIRRVKHAQTSQVFHDEKGIFSGVPNLFSAMRYHSLVIKRGSLESRGLRQTARTSDGTIMGVQSIEYPNVVGVQFHPESYFTEHGEKIFRNFLSLNVKS